MIAIGLLTVPLVALLILGDRSRPQITNFSWENLIIGAQHDYFFLDFNRPMDGAVLDNLTITPPLPGKGAMVGQRLAYTLEDIPSYGREYQITIEDGAELPRSRRHAARPLTPFSATVKTRDRLLAYIGVEGEEEGRLVISNLTREKKEILTPPDLVVTNFQVTGGGDRILFFAFAKGNPDGFNAQELYRTTTAPDRLTEDDPPPGQIRRLLDAQTYQNLQFDLAPGNDAVVIERVNRQNPNDAGLWLLTPNGDLRPLGIQGNRFRISPDGQVVAVRDGQANTNRSGVTILPLTSTATKREFLPAHEDLLAFSPRDYREKIMVKRRDQRQRSLVVINAEGRERELITTTGLILDCHFEPRQAVLLYCLQAERLDPQQTEITPFVTLINVQNGREVPLVALTNDLNVRMAMAPDGRYLAFDQVIESANDSRRQIPPGTVWILPLPDFIEGASLPDLVPPERYAAGLDPQWIP
ncbi:MAG: hypothetical protein EA366_05705 [Spirulina sp. DLM2.Bin59]|nr:MAG: hypothetical protein EA366_05705 [Spirulina sp. DLM2.Bin59]